MFNALINIGTRIVTKVGFQFIKHGPALSIAGGAIGLAVSAYKIGSAKTKLDEIISEKDKQLEKIENTVNDPEYMDQYTEEDARSDSRIVYIKTGMRCVALYTPSIMLGAASVGFIVAGYITMAKRTAALAAAFAATEESYRKYRKNVVEKYGLDADKELYYGLKATEITKEIVADNGDKAEVTETAYQVDPDAPSQYAKFFDASSKEWSKDPDANLNYLIMIQRTMTDRLRARGYLFLNEVYEALDIQPTKAGQVVGWRYNKNNPTGDNFVDFGLYKTNSMASRRFVNGVEPVVLIDPNVDGNIIQYMF